MGKPTPILRSTVESVRSRCRRETGSLALRCSETAAKPRFLGILKIDGIHFVRHGRRTQFSLFVFCRKYSMDNMLGPDIAAEINQDIVYKRFMQSKWRPGCRCSICGTADARVPARSRPYSSFTQLGLGKATWWALKLPVSAAEFCAERDSDELSDLILDPFGKHHHFTQRRAGGLTMGVTAWKCPSSRGHQ